MGDKSNGDVFTPDYYEDIVISPRRTEEFIRNRGMRKVISSYGAAVLLSASLIPASFTGWQGIMGIQGDYLGLLLMAVSIIISFVLLLAFTEMGYVFPYSGGAFAFARQETGVLGGYLAGVCVVIIHVSLAALSLQQLAAALDAFLLPYQAYMLTYLLAFGMAALAVWRTDYYFLFLQMFFYGGVAAIALFAIASWKAGLLNLPYWKMIFLAHPAYLSYTMLFLFCGLAGFASMAEELRGKSRHWHFFVMATYVFSVFAVLYVIVAALETGLISSSGGMLPLEKVINSYYPQDHVLRATFSAFCLCAYVLPFVTGLYYSSRQVYSLSRAGYFPGYFGRLVPKKQTPGYAIVLAAICAVVFSLADAKELMSLSVYSFCMEIILVLFSYWMMLKNEPEIFVLRPAWLRWIVLETLLISVMIFFLVAIGLFPYIYKTIILWFVLILFVYYRGGRYIRDEAPEEAAAMLKERKSRVNLH